jgi:hypothetical protein
MSMIRSIMWMLKDRCGSCGGELMIWSVSRAFAKNVVEETNAIVSLV